MAIEQHIQPAAQKRGKTVRSLSYQYFLQEGDRLFRQHQDPAESDNLLEETLNVYYRAQEQAPDSPEVLSRMAKVFLHQGLYEKAERYAQRALTLIEPDSKKDVLEIYTGLGYIHHQRGYYLEARQAYLKGITSGGFRTGQARLGLARACYALFKNPEQSGWLARTWYLLQGAYAIITATTLLAFAKNWLANGNCLLLPQLLLAWVQEEVGTPDQALERYLDLHQRYPGMARLGILIGDLYRELGQSDKARYWFQSVIRRHPAKLQAYHQLAQLHEQQDAYLEMADVYQQLAELKPGDPHILCNLANAHYYAQNFSKALACYETALHLGNNARWKAMVAQSIANIHADFTQNTEAALAYYKMARDLDPTDIENYIQLGLLYFQKEDYASAERIYYTAIRIAPDNPRLHSNRGYLRWMQGDVENAVIAYEKAIALDSDYEIPLNNLGVIHLDSLGDIRRSIELFRQAIEINESYALAHYNLGRAYSFLNNRLEAAACFRTAQEINEFSKELDSDELAERISKLFDTCE